ncbi:MAG: hypothetical protein ACREER_02460 [Alphaproteobacteria bacterium]
MATDTTRRDGDGAPRPHFMQRVLDNPFLLLFLGVVIPTVFYIVWGVMEIVSVPVAPS